MTSLANYLGSILTNHLFRGTTFAKPTNIAIALCTVAPTHTSTGALTGSEVTSTNTAYARVALNPSTANWNDVTGAPITTYTSNVNAINFATATGDWSTIVAVAISDNVTVGAGNLWFFGTLTQAKPVLNGDSFSFSAGNLSINLDN